MSSYKLFHHAALLIVLLYSTNILGARWVGDFSPAASCALLITDPFYICSIEILVFVYYYNVTGL